jgi:hypothetical protein
MEWQATPDVYDRQGLAEKKRVLFPVRLASYEALRDWKLFDADEGRI